MRAQPSSATSRRTFLTRAAASVALAPMATASASPAVATVDGTQTGSRSSEPARYRTLDADEAAFTEALVRAVCPSDAFTPDGVACGLAGQIDRELSGALAVAARAFAPISWSYGAVCEPRDAAEDRQYFRAGVAAVDTLARERHGVRFADLSASDAVQLLGAIEVGDAVHPRFPAAHWMRTQVRPLLTTASLADPIHVGFGNKVHWKVIGSI